MALCVEGVRVWCGELIDMTMPRMMSMANGDFRCRSFGRVRGSRVLYSVEGRVLQSDGISGRILEQRGGSGARRSSCNGDALRPRHDRVRDIHSFCIMVARTQDFTCVEMMLMNAP